MRIGDTAQSKMVSTTEAGTFNNQINGLFFTKLLRLHA